MTARHHTEEDDLCTALQPREMLKNNLYPLLLLCKIMLLLGSFRYILMFDYSLCTRYRYELPAWHRISQGFCLITVTEVVSTSNQYPEGDWTIQQCSRLVNPLVSGLAELHACKL